MKYTEKLSWNLDKKMRTVGNEEEYRQNIAFVHSLGLKCDCVGWSELDLSSPRAEEILSAIERFCKEEGWYARGWYTREFAESESDWYGIRFADSKGLEYAEEKLLTDSGKPIQLCTTKAYMDSPPAPKGFAPFATVPEQVMNGMLRSGISDVDFCWIRDKGKYQAEQYFQIFPRHWLPHVTADGYFNYETCRIPQSIIEAQQERLRVLGGALPRLSEIFYDLTIALPICYLRSELPESGISGAYVPRHHNICGVRTVLIHKDTAAMLIREKVLREAWLEPVPVMEQFPDGYEIWNAEYREPPSAAAREKLLEQCEALKAKPRPIRMITEKEALKRLRKAKKERKDDFPKALPKAKHALLAESEYAPLLPYYAVANGGYLSEDWEYELLCRERAEEETKDFHTAMAAEELLVEKPAGVVFAKCPDGDAVLLCDDGIVRRYSHEVPEAIEEWPSLPQFFADVITDSD